ncbi:MAG TPA: hypothetical protein VNC79_09170 [Mycobacteriales bacterium]|jgi:uncharacterized membrane protein HdeD (DUF308 family)|nr:hypothetical protein [Mycobacteriales bacterium]
MTGGRIVDTSGAWLLVVLGCLLLLSGASALFGALVDRSWGEAAIVTGVMVFIALGTLRGARQLRRGPGRRRPSDDEG